MKDCEHANLRQTGGQTRNDLLAKWPPAPCVGRRATTKKPTYAIGALANDIKVLRRQVDRGELSAAALLPAAVMMNAKRKLDECSEGERVGQIFEWMSPRDCVMSVTVRQADRTRFDRMSATIGLSRRGVDMAAAAVAALREVQTETGYGHTALDVVASLMPSKQVDNWAAARLRAA